MFFPVGVGNTTSFPAAVESNQQLEWFWPSSMSWVGQWAGRSTDPKEGEEKKERLWMATGTVGRSRLMIPFLCLRFVEKFQRVQNVSIAIATNESFSLHCWLCCQRSCEQQRRILEVTRSAFDVYMYGVELKGDLQRCFYSLLMVNNLSSFSYEHVNEENDDFFLLSPKKTPFQNLRNVDNSKERSNFKSKWLVWGRKKLDADKEFILLPKRH